MINRNLAQGVFLVAISLLFGVGAFNYPIGSFGRPGAGLFPLLVSSLLFVLGLAIALRSFAIERVPLSFNVKNVALIMTSLAGFALLSEHVNMTAGIVFMVLCAGLAATSYSLKRNLMIAGGLLVVAYAMQELLSLQLGLF